MNLMKTGIDDILYKIVTKEVHDCAVVILILRDRYSASLLGRQRSVNQGLNNINR